MATFVENWQYTYNATTTAPPANSQVRLNAAQASASLVWVHINTKDGRDIRTLLLSFLSGSSVYLQDQGNSANWAVYRLTGAPVDKGTYVELPVAYVNGGGAIVTAIDLYGSVNLGTPTPPAITGTGIPGTLAEWTGTATIAPYTGTPPPPVLVTAAQAIEHLKLPIVLGANDPAEADVVAKLTAADAIVRNYLKVAADYAWTNANDSAVVAAAVLLQFGELWRFRGDDPDGQGPAVADGQLSPVLTNLLRRLRDPALA